MRQPLQSGDVFLADYAFACSRCADRVWWLGQSGFLVHAAGFSVLFDPYLSDSLTRKYDGTDKPHVRLTELVVEPGQLTGIDVITSSHNHTDHLDAETLGAVLTANPAAKLVIPAANRTFVLERLGDVAPRLVEIDAGGMAETGGLEFHGIPAAHNEVDRDAEGRCRYLGFVVRIGRLTFYHSGDTKLHAGLGDALRPFRIDVAFLPINGDKPDRRVAGNMDGPEAAQLAHEIGARLVIPHHFDLFAFNTAAPDAFESACRQLGQPFRTLQNGEGMDLA